MQFVTRNEFGSRQATDQAVAAEIAKARLNAVSWRRMTPDEIPADRAFRAAWRDTGVITVDMTMARRIHCDHLRALREPKLSELDLAYWRASEVGNDKAKAKIIAEKQALRAATEDPSISIAETPEELAAAIPAVLTRKYTG